MIESYSVSLFLFSVKLLVLLRSEHITKTSFTQPIDFSSCYKEGCFLSIDLIVQQPAAESLEYIYLQPQMISSIVVYTGKEITYRRMQKMELWHGELALSAIPDVVHGSYLLEHSIRPRHCFMSGARNWTRLNRSEHACHRIKRPYLPFVQSAVCTHRANISAGN